MEEAGRFEKINIHFRITGKDLNRKKVEKAMALSRKNCSMTQSVIGNIEVSETYEIINA
ncbi:OsmC family protein [Metabacillus fastidiosus]